MVSLLRSTRDAHYPTHGSTERLDNQIYFLINELPGKIELAKETIEAATQARNINIGGIGAF